jgi:hypothetical protein
MADAAGREHDRAGRNDDRRGERVAGLADCRPVTAPFSVSRFSGDKTLDHAIDGVCRTASARAAMIAAPAMSPRTCTMRRAECAASRPTASRPSRSRSKRHAVA